MESLAATFGWLCVETYSSSNRLISSFWQPPSGGCVLKHYVIEDLYKREMQPPSGGCVLKP